VINYLHLDGTQGHVVASGYKGIAGPGARSAKARSIAFWIRSTQTNEPSTVVYWGDSFDPDAEDNAQNRIRSVGRAGKLQLFGRSSYRETESGVLDGNWHHVVFTYEGGSTVLYPSQTRISNFADALAYVDGELNAGVRWEDGVTNVHTPAEYDVVIGAQPLLSGTLTDFFEGDLDEIAIWRTAIPPATVSGAYNGGVRGANLKSLPDNHALELWFTMDDPSDNAPNGHVVDQAKSVYPFPGSGITYAGTSILS
jgi:hypothetical protein